MKKCDYCSQNYFTAEFFDDLLLNWPYDEVGGRSMLRGPYHHDKYRSGYLIEHNPCYEIALLESGLFEEGEPAADGSRQFRLSPAGEHRRHFYVVSPQQTKQFIDLAKLSVNNTISFVNSSVISKLLGAIVGFCLGRLSS